MRLPLSGFWSRTEGKRITSCACVRYELHSLYSQISQLKAKHAFKPRIPPGLDHPTVIFHNAIFSGTDERNKKWLEVPRAGTPGWRAPEVLLRSWVQGEGMVLGSVSFAHGSHL